MNEAMLAEIVTRLDGISLLAFQAAQAQAKLQPLFVVGKGLSAAVVIAFTVLLLKRGRTREGEFEPNTFNVAAVIAGACSAVMLIVFGASLSSWLTAWLNPDWWALQEVMKLVRAK